MPVNGRRRSLNAVDCVRIAENRQPFRARGLAGMVHLVSIEILLLHEKVFESCRWEISVGPAVQQLTFRAHSSVSDTDIYRQVPSRKL